MSSKVAPRQVASFWNCYRPLLIWFQLVGISQISEIRSIFWRFAAICYTIAWLFFNIFSHIRTVLTFYLFYGTEDFSATSTYSWNASLVMGNWLLQDIGSHVALILIFQRNGSSLKKAFQNMDSSVPELYTKCRWAVLVCFVYIIVKETVYIMFQMGWPVRNHSLLDNILLISCQVQYYYPSSIFALFCLLSFTISKNFESIRRQISEFQPTFLKVEDMATRLQQWKRRHAATCHCVEELNRTFGFYLLIETCSVFVGVISKFFYILVGVMEKGSVHRGNTLFAIGHLFQLWTICYFTDDLRTQASKISRTVIDLKMKYCFLDKKILIKINGLSKQVVHFLPKITAMEYFRVSRRMFPTLVQTFLTYFIILYQFQSSERNRPNLHLNETLGR